MGCNNVNNDLDLYKNISPVSPKLTIFWLSKLNSALLPEFIMEIEIFWSALIIKGLELKLKGNIGEIKKELTFGWSASRQRICC